MKKRNIGICIITTTLLMGGPAKATELILAKDHTNVVNQAAEIARHAAKSLDLPWQSDVLIRLHDTEPQAGLRREERWSNMRGAFACTEPLQGARILLVDDVLTTGASLSACAEVLRHAGASHIDVAVLARTPEPNAAH